MADNDIRAEAQGLQTSNNTFSASPPGSMAVAENVVIIQKGVAQPRNGQTRFGTMPTAGKVPLALTEFLGSIIANYGIDKTDTSCGLGVVSNPTTGFSSFGGVFNPVDDDGSSESYGRMKFGFADQYLYFCTTTGPKCLETTAGQPRAAGLLRMPDPAVFMASASQLGANGVGLEYGQSRAYRTVLRKPTLSGVSLLSPPSGRFVVQNRILAPVGSMVRNANVVTVTLPGTEDPGLDVADTFTIDPGEANFPAATETVASVTNNVITYADVAANATNTVAQDLDTGPRPVGIIVPLSGDATTSTPVRIYRSRDSDADTPSDEMFLVAEVFPDGTDISNGFLTYLDVTPQSVTDDPLYTNPQTGEGAAQANFAPPIYRDLAYWGSRMWYLQTTGLETLRLQLLGVGAPDGIQDNDTIDIAGETFTFKNTPASPGDVQIVSNGTPSFNIQQTAQNLIEEIFEVFDGADIEIRAYYESQENSAPGKILLEAISYEQTAFGVTASRPASWTPALDTAVDVNSIAEYRPNGLDYSKLGQSEAVPPTNRTAVGSPNYPGARILALQNALLVFKQGDGIWAVTGNAPFQVQQISTANIIAIDAAAVFADAAWAYTDQGILRVSDAGGAVVVSRPIETELNELRAEFPDETANWSFAVPYETERRIMFFVPVEISDETTASGALLPLLRAYCYNNATETWTVYAYAALSGVVSAVANKLALGNYDYVWNTSRVTLERKGGGYLDAADADFSVTISNSTTDSQGRRVVRFASATDIETGDGITQAGFRTKIKTEREDLGTRWFELYENVPLVAGSATIFKHYDVEVLFQPTGHPTSRKTLTRLSFLFKPEQYEAFAGKALVMTDQIQAELEIASPFKGFGLNPFGQGPFGDPSPLVVDINPTGAKWASAAQFFVGFRLSEVWPKFRLQGYTATVITQDGPVGRGSSR